MRLVAYRYITHLALSAQAKRCDALPGGGLAHFQACLRISSREFARNRFSTSSYAANPCEVARNDVPVGCLRSASTFRVATETR